MKNQTDLFPWEDLEQFIEQVEKEEHLWEKQNHTSIKLNKYS